MTHLDTVNYEGEDYHRKRHPELLGSRELRLAWSHFADLTYFQGTSLRGGVFEFGGGLGQNLLAVMRRAEVWMLEPSVLGREVATQDGIRCVASLNELGDRHFGVILCRHVLEHLCNPLDVLLKLHGLLAPGGKLVAVVPCEHWASAPRSPELDHHLFCWNPRTLKNLLERAGYVVEEIRFEHYAGRRKLLPLYRLLGGDVYARLVRSAGRVFGCRELVVVCNRA